MYENKDSDKECERIDVNEAIKQFVELKGDKNTNRKVKVFAMGSLLKTYPDYADNIMNGNLQGLTLDTLQMIDTMIKSIPPTI